MYIYIYVYIRIHIFRTSCQTPFTNNSKNTFRSTFVNSRRLGIVAWVAHCVGSPYFRHRGIYGFSLVFAKVFVKVFVEVFVKVFVRVFIKVFVKVFVRVFVNVFQRIFENISNSSDAQDDLLYLCQIQERTRFENLPLFS